MSNLFINHNELIWPLALFLAWLLGELGQQLTKIPKISFYFLVGFIFAKHQLGILSDFKTTGVSILVNIIAGLVLFEFGYHINLRWLKNNPIIIMTSLVESGITFVVLFSIFTFFGISTLISLQFAALFMASSPFIVMYIINQDQSSGQVTERVLHLTALNCILSTFIFKFMLGLMVFQKSGNLWLSAWSGIVMIILSIALGILCALFLSGILTRITVIAKARTVAFALMIIVMVTIVKSLSLSPIIAALAFGLTSRDRRVIMGKVERNFGALGDLLIIVLFVTGALSLNWRDISQWLMLGFTLFFGRLLTKVIVVAIFSRFSGVSWTKGILTGLALTPISIFPILLLDQNDAVGLLVSHQLLIASALILFLEFIGPIVIHYSLTKAKENGTN